MAPRPVQQRKPRADPPAGGAAASASCRKKPGRALKERLLAEQKHLCFACGGVLLTVEYDHVIPLGLGGSNGPENWAALCPACHRSKTREDLRAIARVKRRRRYQETGRGRASRLGWNGLEQTTGFDKTLRKHLNGWVEKKCSCGKCNNCSHDPSNTADRSKKRKA